MEMRQTHKYSYVHDIEYVEIYVSNCLQAAHYYRTAFGFTVLGELRLDVLCSDRKSIAVQQGNIRLVLTSPLTETSDVAQHVMLHGEGVKDIALSVTDVRAALAAATGAGALPLNVPAGWPLSPPDGRVARIAACGDLVHSLVERPIDRQFQWPALRVSSAVTAAPHNGLAAIDH